MTEKPPQTVSIFDLVQMRMALEQITEPSDKITEAIAILDDHINVFATSLQKGH